MQFLLNKDLNLMLDNDFINQIDTTLDRQIVNDCEKRAIEKVKEYLRGRYDIEYELRPVQDFKLGVEYKDYDRVRIIYNPEHLEFYNTYNIQGLDFGSSTSSEIILVKLPNICEPKMNTVLIPSSYQDTSNQYQEPNINYNPSCGLIYGTNGAVISTNKIKNYYNSIYGSNSITTINYSNVNPSLYIGNLQYFDQYRKEDLTSEWSIDDRSEMLKDVITSILKYELFKRIPNRQHPVNVTDNHDLAIERLMQGAKGILTFNLKKIAGSKEYQNNMPFRWGKSNINRANDW